MTQADIRPLGTRTRASWIRLRTMILLRWFAIAGQLTAVTVAQWVFGLQLAFGLCYLVIGISVVGNLVMGVVFPQNKRLSERENLAMVLFDVLPPAGAPGAAAPVGAGPVAGSARTRGSARVASASDGGVAGGGVGEKVVWVDVCQWSTTVAAAAWCGRVAEVSRSAGASTETSGLMSRTRSAREAALGWAS